MKTTLSIILACAAALGSANAQLTQLSNFSANTAGGFSAGEIPAFDPLTDRLFVTSSGNSVFRVNVFDLSNPASPTAGTPIDFSTSFGAATNMSGLSSVAIDSAGRGFGVATLIPTANTTALGKLGFFNTSTGTQIGTIDVGFHPDSVTFSADGSKLVVVNEGELSGATNAPGSISVLDLSGITSANLSALTSRTVSTYDFSAANLASGVTLAGLRNPSIPAVTGSGALINSVPNFNTLAASDPDFYKGMEPEYASIRGNRVVVSLQENNALAVFDLSTTKWAAVHKLGTIKQTVDGSDRDGTGGATAIKIDDEVHGLPMPDTVATYQFGGVIYVVTANEGDARPDDRDISRLGDTGGDDSMNTILDASVRDNTTLRSDAVLGRLNVSRLDGDSDNDGDIDVPTMLGTRSFSIWNAETGARVYDSGKFFETYISLSDVTGWVDSRSDDKGPEPEGLTLGAIDGRTFAFIGMERTNGIFMFDVTDPTAVSFFDHKRVTDTGTVPLRPEGMAFVSSSESPNGQNLLIVGYEGDGSAVSSERVVVYSVVPEPSTVTLLLAAAACGLLVLRRRK